MDSFRRTRLNSAKMDEILSEDAIMISSADEVDLGSALPTNLYFTICDDLSNDSADFLAINSSNITTQIKQEPQLESINQAPSIQYRLVRGGNANPTPISPTSLTLRAVSVDNGNTRALPVGASNLLSSSSTAVQLPSGCEIYLVKEYVDSDCVDDSDVLISEECEGLPRVTTASVNALGHGVTINQNNTQTSSKVASVSLIPKAIKTEPGTQNQIINVISPKIEKTTTTIRPVAGPAVSNYKKRDEKRRRTHNEVERRRRDKINSWIFKLKEMLPTENTAATSTKLQPNKVSNSLPSTSATSTLSTTTATQFDIVDQVQQQHTAQMQRNSNNHNNSRSPPSDSKSQILIKACEYIKQMQDEVKSLRECLMENEKLRSSNQRLQNEINRLKLSERRRLLNEQQQQCGLSNTSIIDTGDDFTLTLCANSNGHLDNVATSTLFAANTPTSPTSITLIGGGSRKAAISVPYTKRELIISDYVD